MAWSRRVAILGLSDVRSPVGYPESSSVHRKGPKSKVLIPGLVPVDSSLVRVLNHHTQLGFGWNGQTPGLARKQGLCSRMKS